MIFEIFTMGHDTTLVAWHDMHGAHLFWESMLIRILIESDHHVLIAQQSHEKEKKNRRRYRASSLLLFAPCICHQLLQESFSSLLPLYHLDIKKKKWKKKGRTEEDIGHVSNFSLLPAFIIRFFKNSLSPLSSPSLSYCSLFFVLFLQGMSTSDSFSFKKNATNLPLQKCYINIETSHKKVAQMICNIQILLYTGIMHSVKCWQLVW